MAQRMEDLEAITKVVQLYIDGAGGDERAQLYLMDPEGETLEALTANPKVIHRFGGFSRDGAWICYSSNQRTERLFDVYVMELATRQARRRIGAR